MRQFGLLMSRVRLGRARFPRSPRFGEFCRALLRAYPDHPVVRAFCGAARAGVPDEFAVRELPSEQCPPGQRRVFAGLDPLGRPFFECQPVEPPPLRVQPRGSAVCPNELALAGWVAQDGLAIAQFIQAGATLPAAEGETTFWVDPQREIYQFLSRAGGLDARSCKFNGTLDEARSEVMRLNELPREFLKIFGFI